MRTLGNPDKKRQDKPDNAETLFYGNYYAIKLLMRNLMANFGLYCLIAALGTILACSEYPDFHHLSLDNYIPSSSAALQLV